MKVLEGNEAERSMLSWVWALILGPFREPEMFTIRPMCKPKPGFPPPAVATIPGARGGKRPAWKSLGQEVPAAVYLETTG